MFIITHKKKEKSSIVKLFVRMQKNYYHSTLYNSEIYLAVIQIVQFSVNLYVLLYSSIILIVYNVLFT